MKNKQSKNTPKIVYVGFAFLHHKTGHGGYHHIADSGLYDGYIDCQNNYERQFNDKSGLSKYWHFLMRKLFDFEAFPFFFFRCLFYSLTHRNVVFHIIYGENLYIPLFKFIAPFAKVVCTLHQPFSRFSSNSWKKRLKRMDGIILVSEQEIELFKAASRNKNVIYIPHGVYTDFFKPMEEVKKERIVLTVGNWLRDYTFANKIYHSFLQKFSDWRICVVANKSSLDLIEDDNRIHKCSGISDEELRLLYCKSSILFLPLIRYTANNALLEAAACGCNVLIACNNSDNSYIPDDLFNKVSLDEREVISQMSVLQNYSYNNPLTDFVTQNYSWDVISHHTIQFLKSL